MKEEIKKFFKGEVEDDEETLTKYSRDASIFIIRPKLVLFPLDSMDVQKLVKWVGENKQKYPDLSVTARCAGTDMSGGAISESLVMDFTRHMNKLISGPSDLNPEGYATITVQPGMFYRDFEKITLEKGLILPCFTASKSLNAMGGMYGNNSAGERTLKYGKTEDYVIEAKVVFSDGVERVVKELSKEEYKKKSEQKDFEGNAYKKIGKLIDDNKDVIMKAKPAVHKNSAGYYVWNVERPGGNFNLNRILVGSQGTLGIATEITFKLLPTPKHTRLLVVFLRDIGILPDLVNKILEHKPQTLESYDDKTLLLVFKYIWSFAKLLGLEHFFRLIWSFWPETLMTLRHGFPRIVLLVEFTGDSAEVADNLAKEAIKDLKSVKGIGFRLTRNKFESEKYWTIRRQAFNLIRFHLKKMKSEAFVDDVIVRPEKLPEFYPALYKILNEYKGEMTFAVGGHSGEGNMHIYTLLDPKDPHLKEIVLNVSNQVYSLVVKLGGSITAEHNDGLVRTPFLPEMYGEKIMDIFKDVKEIFDPKDILNPGKKIAVPRGPGTKEYLKSHIAVEKGR